MYIIVCSKCYYFVSDISDLPDPAPIVCALGSDSVLESRAPVFFSLSLGAKSSLL